MGHPQLWLGEGLKEPFFSTERSAVERSALRLMWQGQGWVLIEKVDWSY